MLTGDTPSNSAALAILAVLVAGLFLWQPSGLYLWLKAVHVMAVIAWMAGMLYLPRLFVYHAEAEKGSVQSETFKVMERRLYRGITTPAMIATWIFGLWLAFGFGIVDFSQGWMWLKAILVIALSAFSWTTPIRTMRCST